MSTNTHAPNPFKPFVRPVSPPTARLQRLGKIAFATLAVCTLAAGSLSAQSSYQAGNDIAVIDVAYIFKNLPDIKAQVSKVESDLKAREAELKQKRDVLNQSIAQLKTLKVGTADYARHEERVASLDTKLRLDTARIRQELNSAQAKIYYDNYQRIAAAVKAIATHNHIKLVLRFDSEEMDLEKNDSVARGLMKSIVFHDPSIDMTDTVMKYLEQQAAKTQVASGRRASPPPPRR